MFWWIVLCILLGLLLLICLILLIPMGIRVQYRNEELKLWFVIGVFRIFFDPKWIKKKDKPKDKKKEKKENNSSKIDYRTVLKEPIEANRPFDGALGKFWAELRTIIELFGVLSPKLCIRRLELKLHLAGADPYTLALMYGGAWAAIGGLLPLLEEVFVVKKRDLDVDCDFMGERTTLEARLEAVTVIGRVLYCFLRYILTAPDTSALTKLTSANMNNNSAKGGK